MTEHFLVLNLKIWIGIKTKTEFYRGGHISKDAM